MEGFYVIQIHKSLKCANTDKKLSFEVSIMQPKSILCYTGHISLEIINAYDYNEKSLRLMFVCISVYMSVKSNFRCYTQSVHSLATGLSLY